MTRRTELLALAERVEAGETGREIRIDIAVALGWERGTYGYTRPPNTRNWTYPSALPAWELSIDAQAALPRRIAESYMLTNDGSQWMAEVDGLGDHGQIIRGTAATEPAARLAATLRAMAEDAA